MGCSSVLPTRLEAELILIAEISEVDLEDERPWPLPPESTLLWEEWRSPAPLPPPAIPGAGALPAGLGGFLADSSGDCRVRGRRGGVGAWRPRGLLRSSDVVMRSDLIGVRRLHFLVC